MFFSNLAQYSHTGFVILRLALAIVFLVHGVAKLFKAKMMGQSFPGGVSGVFVLGTVESLSALAIIFNYYLQLGALLLALVMLGAGYMKIVKWKVPFIAMDKTGWELDFVLFAISVAFLLGLGMK